eukprot:gene30361-37563_t
MYNLFERHTSFLNAAFKHENDVHYWQILGDNFYDRDGQVTSEWFAELSTDTKSAFFSTVPGNHDFWIDATPRLFVEGDQLGNGFMQFYGQDTLTLVVVREHYQVQIGNTAFIGFSGAHTHSDMSQYFDDACEWAVKSAPDGMFYKPKARTVSSRASSEWELLRRRGESGGSEIGMPVVDTTGGRFRVYYFVIAQNTENSVDNFEDVLSCVQNFGLSRCYQYATL